MPFALLDDRFHSNPKIRGLGLDGVGLYALALSYCAAYVTDGFVPREWALAAAGGKWGLLNRLAEHGAWEEIHERDEVTLSDRSGNVWVRVEKKRGYFIPDFLQFNPSSVEQKERSEKRASSGRKGAIKRWADSKHHGKTHGVSHEEADSKRMAQNPYPVEELRAEDLLLKADRTETTHPNGLPIEKERLTLQLLTWISDHGDEGTANVVRSYSRSLPEGTLAKVLESTTTAKAKDRAKYVVAALRNEVGQRA